MGVLLALRSCMTCIIRKICAAGGLPTTPSFDHNRRPSCVPPSPKPGAKASAPKKKLHSTTKPRARNLKSGCRHPPSPHPACIARVGGQPVSIWNRPARRRPDVPCFCVSNHKNRTSCANSNGATAPQRSPHGQRQSAGAGRVASLKAPRALANSCSTHLLLPSPHGLHCMLDHPHRAIHSIG